MTTHLSMNMLKAKIRNFYLNWNLTILPRCPWPLSHDLTGPSNLFGCVSFMCVPAEYKQTHTDGYSWKYCLFHVRSLSKVTHN